ncbi:SusC/RagA family TonB-linked outer membrane protein [Flavobacterium sp. ZS1P14]|uniref:SusC/RagA family TonB-linked outer membrane protein n=1 Tax=Flavobacterium sp. ZS1P14 TaxID=3401729 RepID=UPI003AAFE04C
MKNFTATRRLHFYDLEFDLMKNLSLLFLVVSSFQIQAKVTTVTKLTAEIQQERTISGVVTNGKGEPLPGVSIVAQGTTNGTTTDFDGRFTLKINNDVKTLVVSFADYETEEITIGNKTEFKIALKDVFESLQEVVVIGYGTQKRDDITGAISSVPKERLENLPVTNILHAIEGTTAGLKIAQSSSVPGSSASVQIRGVNSINANSSPLIVLDGIPFFGTTNDISPNDIKSIEILKDASAVAIYGTRGSNGVILITSERGNASNRKPIIKYRGYSGVEDMANVLKPMGAAAYVQKYADFQKANNLTQTTVLPNASEEANYDAGITTDWLKDATRSGIISENNLSISSGTSKFQYFISGGKLNQKGVVKGYQFQKTNFRVNIDSEITDYLKVGSSAFFTENNYDGGRAGLLNATAMSPYSVPYDANGGYLIYPMAPELLFTNPLLGLTTDRLDRGKNLTGSGFAEVTPIKGLSYRLNASFTYNIDRFATYTGRKANDPNGTAYVSNTETSNWVVENIVNYTKDFKKHHVDFTGLYSAQKVDYFKSEAQAVGFINDGLSYHNLNAGAIKSTASSANGYTLLSQMGRMNYSYDNRYLLTLTARRDGYSAFGTNTSKYGIFPSVALGWNIKNEAFLKDVAYVDILKLRLSHGKTGNQAIGVNQTATTVSIVQQPFDGVAYTGVLYTSLGNADLNWETTTSSNIGLDFSVLNSRIGGSVEVYKSKTDDILLRRSIPNITGYNNIWDNLGKMQNVGIEVSLNTVNIRKADFSWETVINFSKYNNKLLDLYGDGKDDLGNTWFIGKPLNVAYDYEKTGIWQAGEEAQIALADPVAKPGDLKFKDQNGDGKISDDDKVILGQRDPKWTGGLINTFSYKNFNFSVFIETSQGGLKSNRDLTYADEAGRRNLPEDFKYWTAENKDNYWPSLSAYKNYRGYNFFADYSYVRIKDIKLSYQFPMVVLGKYLEGVTLYVSGRNLYTFTNWYGWDPEMNYSSRGSTDWQNNYPAVRTFSFGINITL